MERMEFKRETTRLRREAQYLDRDRWQWLMHGLSTEDSADTIECMVFFGEKTPGFTEMSSV